MAEGVTQESVESAVEAAFGNPPPKVSQPPPLAPEPAEQAPVAADAAPEIDPDAEPAEVEAAPAVAEPEFEIEINGQKELVKGKEQITALLQKGTYFSRGAEENARVREALAAHIQVQQNAQQFQQAIVDDIAQFRALDDRMNEFNKIDWSTAIDGDFVGAMKLQEQRNAIREARNAKLTEIQQKQTWYQTSQAEATHKMLESENAALLAKLPEWRNSDKATAEKATVFQGLIGDYGFQPQELSQLMDHRMVLVARDAMKWRALQRGKDDKLKQVREAPPVSKPGAIASEQQGKVGFQKFQQDFRRQGRSGNHRVQESSLEKILARTFK